jgi:acyl-CoA thioesterase FadM
VLRVRTRISESGTRIVKFSYELFREADEQLLATGETTHVICGKNGRPKSLPGKYRAVLAVPAGQAAKRRDS